jgi:hypothetical protein
MERLLQWMDDLDDLMGAIGLVYERLRRLLLTTLVLIIGLASVVSGVLLAHVHTRIALATCLILFVTLLYRMVTSTPSGRLQTI